MSTLLVPLNEFDLLHVQGPDSARFLQGQLTCNVDRVSAEQSVRGACCTLKGRVITDFRLFRRGETYTLQTEAGLATRLQQTLNRYIVFSKAETALADLESAGVQRFGLFGDDATALLAGLCPQLPRQTDACLHQEAYSIFCVDAQQQRYEIFQFGEDRALLSALQELAQPGTPEHWRAADIRAGLVHIRPGMEELYTPEVLNYDLSGLVDFKKGCYTGQEIIARMHYRGKAKKRAVPLQADTGIGQVVLHIVEEDGATQAEILSQSTVAEQSWLLAILPVDSLSGQSRFELSSSAHTQPRVPAHRLPLPWLNDQET